VPGALRPQPAHPLAGDQLPGPRPLRGLLTDSAAGECLANGHACTQAFGSGSPPGAGCFKGRARRFPYRVAAVADHGLSASDGFGVAGDV
jgi:hypothetical protein